MAKLITDELLPELQNDFGGNYELRQNVNNTSVNDYHVRPIRITILQEKLLIILDQNTNRRMKINGNRCIR